MEQKNTIIEELEARTGKKWISQSILKNNGAERIGIMMDAKAENITTPIPVVYAEDLGGMSVDEAVDFILNVYESYSTLSYNAEEFIIRHPEIRVVNKEKNKEFLKTAPYEDLAEDLAIIFIEVVEDTDNGVASFRITNDMLKHANMPVEELSAIAKYNTLKYQVFTQGLANIAGMMLDEDDEMHPDNLDEVPPIQVISLGNDMFQGARILAFPELLDEVIKEDSYIIPSSIHELLVIPKSISDVNYLRALVCEVNQTAVVPTDFLSDNVYEFNKELKEVRIAS